MINAINTIIVNEGKPLPFWFEPSVDILEKVVTTGTALTGPYDDKLLITQTTQASTEEARIIIETQYDLSSGFADITFTSSDPSLINITPSGSAFLVSTDAVALPGATVDIEVAYSKNGKTVKRTFPVTLNNIGSSTINFITGGAPGTPREDFTSFLDNRLLDGFSTGVSQSKKLFSTADHETATYVYNPDFYLYDTHIGKLTCIVAWNSRGGDQRGAVMITPWHFVCSHHFALEKEDLIRCVATDGTVHERIVASSWLMRVSSSEINPNDPDGNKIIETDVRIGRVLDPFPPSIQPCKLFPKDFADWMPAGPDSNFYSGTQIPVMVFDQDKNANIFEFIQAGGEIWPEVSPFPPSGAIPPYAYFLEPTLEIAQSLYNQAPILLPRYEFREELIIGDSGSPVFFVSETELLLVGCVYTKTQCPFLSQMSDREINFAITIADTIAAINQNDFSLITNAEPTIADFNATYGPPPAY